jgi:hypothetical protein
MEGSLQRAVVEDFAGARRKRRVVLAVDREPLAAGGQLPQRRLDRGAGGAFALHDRNQAIGKMLHHGQC